MMLPALCRSRVEALLDSGQRRILGIVAPPGAGKSTLAKALAAEFPDGVQVVPMDGFHLANSELLRLGRSARSRPATWCASSPPSRIFNLHRTVHDWRCADGSRPTRRTRFASSRHQS